MDIFKENWFCSELLTRMRTCEISQGIIIRESVSEYLLQSGWGEC